MVDFGFNISSPRSVDLDKANMNKRDQLLERVPSYSLCIGCGGCSATCTAQDFVKFSIRQAHIAFSRGQYDGLAKQLDKCMLCGKCMLVCPRGVNTRSLIINMRKLLEEE